MCQGRHGHTQLTGQLAEVEQLRAAFGNRPRPVFDACQGQQLIGQVGQAIRALRRRFQGAAPDRRLLGAQPQLQAGFERGQRGA